MKRFPSRLLLCLGSIPAAPLSAAAPPAGPSVSEVGRLVEQLVQRGRSGYPLLGSW